MRFLKDGISAILITALVVWLFNTFSVMRRFDELIYAFRFPSGGWVSKDIVLVEITNETLKALGGLPFDRKFHAQVLEKLASNGNLIGVTLWFDQPVSEPGDSQLARVASMNKKIVFSRPVWTANGQILYPQLASAKPTTAVDDFVDSANANSIGVVAIDTHFGDPVSKGWLETIPVKLFRLFNEGNKPPDAPRSSDTDPFNFIRQYNLQFSVGHPISLEPLNLRMPINYVGDAEAFERVSYERLLANEDFSWIKGKIVIIGLAVPGQGVFTPLSTHNGRLTSRLVVIANALNTLVTGQHIRTLPPLVTSAGHGVFCLLLLLAFRRAENFRTLVRSSLMLLGGLLVLHQVLFVGLRFQMMVFPFFMIAIFVLAYRAAIDCVVTRFIRNGVSSRVGR